MVKVCGTCAEEKPRDLFPKKGAHCKDCKSKMDRDRRAKESPEESRLRNRKNVLYKYGLSWSDYVARVDAQGGACAVCGDEPPTGKSLAIDHDHSCCPKGGSCGGCVRGLLCHGCNGALGLAKDRPEVLRTLALYLELGGL